MQFSFTLYWTKTFSGLVTPKVYRFIDNTDYSQKITLTEYAPLFGPAFWKFLIGRVGGVGFFIWKPWGLGSIFGAIRGRLKAWNIKNMTILLLKYLVAYLVNRAAYTIQLFILLDLVVAEGGICFAGEFDIVFWILWIFEVACCNLSDICALTITSFR